MFTVLITGGCGFIGSAYVRHAIQKRDCRIINVDKLTYAANLKAIKPYNLSGRYAFHQLDIGDRTEIQKVLVEAKPNAIVNFAAETHVDRSIDNPAAFVATNVVATTNFLTEALSYWRELSPADQKSFRFLHISTDEVYGALLPGDPPFNALSPYRPNSPYAASKAASDHFVRSFSRTYGLPVLITNCSNNYGPWQNPEKLIPLTIVKATLGEEIPVFGRGENLRDWLYVDDHIEGLRLTLDKAQPGETYCFGTGTEARNIDVVTAICELVDERLGPLKSGPRKNLINFAPDRPGHDFRYAIDPGDAKRALNWRPQVNLKDGLAHTVAWYLHHREWWENLRMANHGFRRLGLGKPEIP